MIKDTGKEETTLVIMKPDAVQRNLLGEIIHRFERKGLKIMGLKMMRLSSVLLDEHYALHKDKPFFESLRRYMQSAPVVVLALSGINAIGAVRLIVGRTRGYEALAGSIRGDFSVSGQTNIVHASDSKETAQDEIKRFFSDDELFDYQRVDHPFLYGEDEWGS